MGKFTIGCEPVQITETCLIEKINRTFNINVTDKSKKRKYVYLRAIIAKRLRDKGLSLTYIGNELDKDHTTIIHYLKLYENSKQYPDFKKLINKII